ncbi:MAG: electron transfer flavoprotein subunit beta [Gammaproteobacteria bacterium]|nr:electron transfer flavoprotein subunit beta [Gammaproteobacteria bacterium]
MSLEVAVLVSIGRHPVSGRARRADGDARAVEMALKLCERYGARLRLVHAGDPDEPTLRQYAGMGRSVLVVLELASGLDALPVISRYLCATRPRLVLTGGQAEQGHCTGQLPYALAEALGYPIVTSIAGIELGLTHADLFQALPRGRRRGLRASLPAVASVARAATAPRQSAFAQARRALIVREAVPDASRVPAPIFAQRPSRPHLPRAQAAVGATGIDRLRAIREAPVSRGQRIEGAHPDEVARAILDHLAVKAF